MLPRLAPPVLNLFSAKWVEASLGMLGAKHVSWGQIAPSSSGWTWMLWVAFKPGIGSQ
jgi:hypothetical protein